MGSGSDIVIVIITVLVEQSRFRQRHHSHPISMMILVRVRAFLTAARRVRRVVASCVVYIDAVSCVQRSDKRMSFARVQGS